jgi:hypothetical protein|tara:strand:+ start:1055 stop:1567 length:513 start_codon:yes stop_codon:yes gene_type:complete
MIKKRDKSQLEKVFDDHSKWIKTVKGFGATKEDAEDIVGEMYLTIGKMINKGLDISYKDEVNYYYIYIALKTRFINMIKKKNKYPTVEILDDKNIDESESVNYEEAQNILEAELDLMMLDKKTWYNAKVFKMIQEGSSLVQLSELTGISYHSLYHTYRNTKNKLKEKITE